MTVEDVASTARNAHSHYEPGFDDFVKTGPDTVAGRYLRSFWQPVYRSHDLPNGEAKPIRIMSEDLTLYRGDDGVARVVGGRCKHRGAKLSIGWVDGNDIRCAYHGWTYDGDGRCVRQPAETRPFCDKVRIAGYPTREYIGLIFAYLGGGEPPPFPRYPEFEHDEFYMDASVKIWPCNYWAQLENALDIAHTAFLHWHFRYQLPERIMAEETPYGVRCYSPGISGNMKVDNPGRTGSREIYDTLYFHMPNMHEWLAPRVAGEKIGYFAKSWRVPRDDGSHIRLDVRVVPLKGDEREEFRLREEARQKQSLGAGVLDVVDDLLAGRRSFRQLREGNLVPPGDLTNIQDCTAMASLEPMASRDYDEMLGQIDVGIALLRRLWKKELQSFAATGTMREWKRPEFLWESVWA